MSTVNDFLPFCPTDSGTNLLTEAEYLAAAGRTAGNQPGVASSKLNNKALRQATYIASQLAQLISNRSNTDVLDDATPTKLLAQMYANFSIHYPVLTKYASGSGTHALTYIFFVGSGSATTGATYTNNSVTFTVVNTVASGVAIRMTGASVPLTNGVLTKTGGTGDTTLNFYAFKTALYMKLRLVGGGGGGGQSGVAATGTAGGTGGDTTFGSFTGQGGSGGSSGAAGAAGGGTSGSPLFGLTGGRGQGSSRQATSPTGYVMGGHGGSGPFGGPGGGGGYDAAGLAAVTNSGGGGGGGGGNDGTATNIFTGSGGGSGGYLETDITLPSGTYAYGVGAAGSAGSAGTSGFAGGAGGSGVVLVEEYFQ